MTHTGWIISNTFCILSSMWKTANLISCLKSHSRIMSKRISPFICSVEKLKSGHTSLSLWNQRLAIEEWSINLLHDGLTSFLAFVFYSHSATGFMEQIWAFLSATKKMRCREVGKVLVCYREITLLEYVLKVMHGETPPFLFTPSPFFFWILRKMGFYSFM